MEVVAVSRTRNLRFLQRVVYSNAKAYRVYATAKGCLVAEVAKTFEGLFDGN
jgi:hypothetical protein